MRHPEPLPEPPSWLVAKVKQRITVHTLNSMSISGVLESADDDGVILRAARVLDGKPFPPTGVHDPNLLAGEIWIPREQVAFAQLSG